MDENSAGDVADLMNALRKLTISLSPNTASRSLIQLLQACFGGWFETLWESSIPEGAFPGFMIFAVRSQLGGLFIGQANTSFQISRSSSW